ncbi:MAG: TerB family tellurite resistance protein [Immundisolibacteraceae bacterium]|nr:TerB family tellurite resistance protein [Immundisolibacteraceae bacterium]
MFKNVSQFFTDLASQVQDQDTPETAQHLEMVMAALMIEMARADGEVEAIEIEQIKRMLEQRFNLQSDAQEALLALANDKADHATSLFEFTSQLKTLLDQPTRIEMIDLLWSVAYADDKLDRYEEQLVRKVADLLYVPHSEFIASKHRASDNR